MSIHLITLNDKTKQIHAISDKRTMQAVVINGTIVQQTHLNDDAMKIYRVNDHIYCACGGDEIVSNRFQNEIVYSGETDHLIPSQSDQLFCWRSLLVQP